MPEWAKNRVVLGLLVFFSAVGVWEFRLKPQFRPMYEQGIVLYQRGRYLEALREFERAYALAPNQVEIIVMAGWSNLKLRHHEEARFYFQRALRIEPRNVEAQLGAALVDWQSGRAVDEKRVRALESRYPDDPAVRAMAAAVRSRGGRK